MAPTWKLDSAGRRVVERKDETKKAIGRSPDDADAMNLAYHQRDFSVSVISPDEQPDQERERILAARDSVYDRNRGADDRRPIWQRAEDGSYESAARRRGLFGAGQDHITGGFGWR
jgi:hypothetical protein